MSELLSFLLNNDPSFRRARLAALYSDFRPLRTLNPDGFQANISAWTKGLSAAAKAGCLPSHGSTPDSFILQVDDELLRALDTKEWGRPLSLGTVFAEACKRGEMMNMNEFGERKESIYKRKWGIGPWEALEWGLRQIGVVRGGEENLKVGSLVLIGNLEGAAGELEKRCRGRIGRVERIFSKRKFEEEFGGVVGSEKGLSDRDMDVFLSFLARDKGLLAYEGETIKLKRPEEALASPITAEDITIASLTSLIADLEVQTTDLEKRIDKLGVTAKEAVTKKNRVSALAALRSRKLAESTLSKRRATLGQLEEVFSKIEQAADQVELVRVMQGSTQVLRGLNKEVGGVEKVDDVVDQLREQMSEVDEVGNVIAEIGQGNVDEMEVDDELEVMEKEVRQKREENQRAEREEREKQEAAETKRKLDALEEVERAAARAKQGGNKKSEKDVMETEQELKRLSLEPITNIPV
ncbi:hypothetical protein B7494_g4707 [Chlorociboria aeruginascens]|nr:hypothetical protein B7494_g4707 [Chlorociboria aeruginascens]